MIYQESVLIPKSRIAVLIGEKGAAKKAIETAGDVRLRIDSKNGNVLVRAKDALSAWQGANVIRAVARGFPPEVARKLFKPDYSYESISLENYAKNKNDLVRIRGRLIGTDGKARDRIQFLTQAQIRVQGKTVAILGEVGRVALARHAIDMLLSGSPHARVFAFLKEQTEGEVQAEKTASAHIETQSVSGRSKTASFGRIEK